MIFQTSFFDWYYVIYTIVLFLLLFITRMILVFLRKKTDQELERLLFADCNLFLYETLLNNRRLRLIYTNIQIEILKLNGFMALGTDEQVSKQLDHVYRLKLNHRQMLDFHHKRFTYFIEIGRYKEALISFESLKNILEKEKNSQAGIMLEEASLIVDIYIHHNTSLIPTLLESANQTQHPIMKGIFYFRIAKLYYYLNQPKQIIVYLDKAAPLLKHTTYEEIIKNARKDNHILSIK